MSSAARRISETFLRAAAAPLEQAALLIAENKVPQALDLLAPAALAEAYRAGAREVAQLASVSTSDVEQALPMAEHAALSSRLLTSHPRAHAAWRAHAGELGFFDAITELTVDGSAPDVAVQLDRVAHKIRRDRALSTPLAELSVDLGEYTDLVARSAQLLADGDWLGAAMRRKKLRTIVTAAVPTTLIVVVTVLIAALQLRRSAIEEALALDDACEASARGAELSSYASREQERRLTERKAACSTERTKREAEAREAAQREAREATEAAAREAKGRACDALANALGTGSALPAEHRAAMGAEAELVERVGQRKLLPSDVGPESPALPCEGTTHRAAIEGAFAKALLADVSLWTVRGDPSPFVHGLLVMHVDEIPERAKLGLADHAERTAKRGLVRGEDDTLARAKRLCTLARALGVAGRSACDAVEARP